MTRAQPAILATTATGFLPAIALRLRGLTLLLTSP
jgi:hypothetical protein